MNRQEHGYGSPFAVSTWLEKRRLDENSDIIMLTRLLHQGGNDFKKHGTSRSEIIGFISKAVARWFEHDSILLAKGAIERFLSYGYTAEEMGLNIARYENYKLQLRLQDDNAVSYLQSHDPKSDWQGFSSCLEYIDSRIEDGLTSLTELGISIEDFQSWYSRLSLVVAARLVDEDPDALAWLWRETFAGLRMKLPAPITAEQLHLSHERFAKLRHQADDIVDVRTEFDVISSDLLDL